MNKNKNAKRFFAPVLASAMFLTACGGAAGEQAAAVTEADGQLAGDLNNDGQIEMGQDGVEVDVNVSDIHLDAAEAYASGNWEALFTPVEIDGRAIDMADIDLTPTEEEKAAMEAEPAYGQPVLYYMSDGCTAGPTVADDLGYYEEAGLTAEGFMYSTFYIIIAVLGIEALIYKKNKKEKRHSLPKVMGKRCP